MTEENNTEVESTEEKEEVQLTKGDILKIISNAVNSGNMTGQQAAKLRAEEFGIFGSNYTKKKTTKSKRKSQRKAQKKARAITRQRGYKGQKSPSGRRKAA